MLSSVLYLVPPSCLVQLGCHVTVSPTELCWSSLFNSFLDSLNRTRRPNSSAGLSEELQTLSEELQTFSKRPQNLQSVFDPIYGDIDTWFLLDPSQGASLQVEILSVRLFVRPPSLLFLFLIQTLCSRNLSHGIQCPPSMSPMHASQLVPQWTGSYHRPFFFHLGSSYVSAWHF